MAGRRPVPTRPVREWFIYLSTTTATVWSVPTTAREWDGRWRVGKTEGPKWPVSRIRIRVPTFMNRDKGGPGPGGRITCWCPPGVCFGVYQREWALTEDLEVAVACRRSLNVEFLTEPCSLPSLRFRDFGTRQS